MPPPAPTAPAAGNAAGELRSEVDSIVETIIYLYTESRRLTKGMAREVGLTGPQLTVIKLLETFDNLSPGFFAATRQCGS